MLMPPCTPDELDELAGLISDGHLGKTSVDDLPLEQHFENIKNDAAEVKTAKEMGLWSSIFRGKFPGMGGVLPHVRTASGGLGEVLTAEALDPLYINVNKANKVIADMGKEMNEILGKVSEGGLLGKVKRKFTGISSELDEKLRTALEGGSTANFTDAEKNAVKEVKVLFNKIGQKTGLEFEPFTYLRDNPVDAATLKQAPPQYAAAADYLKRRGQFRDPNQKLVGLFSEYLNAAVTASMKKPATDEFLGRLKVHFTGDGTNVTGIISPSGPEMQIANGLVADILGRPVPFDVKVMQQVDDMYRWAFPNRKPPGLAGLYQFSTVVTDLATAGTMGGRPASVIRQFFQLIPMWAEFGGKYSRQAMAEVLNDIRGPRQMMEQYAERGLMSSTFERLDQSIEMGGKAGKTVSAVSETLMKGFAASDAFVRVVTARSAELRFNEFLAKDAMDKLPGKREVRDEVLKSIRNGQTDVARDQYIANHIRDLQYDFGRTNRPAYSRGAVGRLATMFMSYPLNTAEMLNSFTKRAIKGGMTGDYGEMLPMVRLMAATYAVGMVGSEFLDADMSSALVYGALPHSTFFPKAALDTWNTGRSSIEWSMGKVFNTGETQYAKNFREHSYNSVENFVTSMIPGWNAASDIKKTIDEGTLTKMLAIMPKGPVLDQQARERQRLQHVQ
jgi:hypothetical protein